MLQVTTNYKVYKTLCDNSSIHVLFIKVILKWMGVPYFFGGTGGKIRLNVEK